MVGTAIRNTARIFFLIFIGLLTYSIQAQQQETPLLRLLNQIPDGEAAAETFSYVDYRAIVETRSGAPLITSADDWEALVSRDAKELSLWMAAFFGVASGPSDLLQNVREPLPMRDVTGIDLFAIERAFAYGMPPGEVWLLEGEFDTEAIANTHIERDYQEQTVVGVTLWCGNDDCDGSVMDLSSREPADPFGGRLGRRQPLFVTDSLVASSANTDRLVALAQAVAGETDSLAQNDNYLSLAEAITQKGRLLQAWFISPLDIMPASANLVNSLIGEELSADQIEALRAEMEAEFTPLPQYRLLGFADTVSDSEQIAIAALVYNDAEKASEAAEIVVQQIEDYVSLATQEPLSDMLEERGVTAVETSIYENDERAVLLVSLHAPLPAEEPIAEGLGPVSSSLVFHLLINMYQQRDLGWLATAF